MEGGSRVASARGEEGPEAASSPSGDWTDNTTDFRGMGFKIVNPFD